MTNSIKVVRILYPKTMQEAPKVELLVSRSNGPATEAKKVVIPVGTTMDLDAGFWAKDMTPALGISGADGIGTGERIG